jgi:hypothetical protein
VAPKDGHCILHGSVLLHFFAITTLSKECNWDGDTTDLVALGDPQEQVPVLTSAKGCIEETHIL